VQIARTVTAGETVSPARQTLWRLADYLRRVRQRAGLSYQEAADRTRLPKATLQRAADGKTLPGSQTVEAYAVARGRDPRTAVRWRERAADARRPKRHTISCSRPVSSPDPTRTPRLARIVRSDQVTTFDGRLPPSTTSDLLRAKHARHEVVLAFAQACGESDAALREWAEAWSRAWPSEPDITRMTMRKRPHGHHPASPGATRGWGYPAGRGGPGGPGTRRREARRRLRPVVRRPAWCRRCRA
jgi:transcriptional regulator with XRE-family HTH domain